MKTRGGDRAEPGLRRLVIIDLVDDEQHHRVLEQIVVERAEQLGDEQRQEAARAEQVGGAVHQAWLGSDAVRRMPGQSFGMSGILVFVGPWPAPRS